MLTGLTIGNFKAFGDPPQHIPIRPITLIFGANSSGKSSILHSLLLANHAMETGNWDVHRPMGAGNAVDLGGFPNYLHNQRAEVPLTFALETGLRPGALEKGLLGSKEELAAFTGLTRFRWCLQVARERAPDDPPESRGLLALQTASLDLNGEPGLVFRRTASDLFKCQELRPENAFIRSVLESILRLSAQRSEKAGNHADAECIRSGLPTLQRELVEAMSECDFLLGRMPSPYHEYTCLSEFGADPLPTHSDYTEDQYQVCGGTLLDLCVSWFDNGRGRENSLDMDTLRRLRDLLGLPPLSEEPAGAAGRSDMPKGVKLQAEAQAVRIDFARMLRQLSFFAGFILKWIVYLGPLRQVPRRHPGGDWQGASETPGSGLQEWRTVCEVQAVRDTINRWLGKDWLETDYRVGVQEWVDKDNPGALPLRNPIFYAGDTGTRLSVHDLGFGIGQVLPVLTRAAAAKLGVTCVEQPELHLHPALQAELGDVFIESAVGERKNTFLLETHSEHLILRILRRVRETTEGKLPEGKTPVRPEDVAVVYVQPGPKGAEVIELPVTPDGDFGRSWPGGFFAERFQELP